MNAASTVEQAVDQFYAALNRLLNGDPAPMQALWSDAPYVSAMHSLGDHEVGGAQVRDEWARVSERVSSGEVTFESLSVHANGDMGVSVGIERGSVTVNGKSLDVHLRVTNVFERQDGTWKVIHHHADTIPAIERAIDQERR